MSEFKLSRRSLDRLEGIDDGLQAVIKMAITLTKTDFGVVQGMRTIEQQKELVAKDFKGAAKEVLGSCISIGVTVDGKEPKEVQKAIDNGAYDKYLNE